MKAFPKLSILVLGVGSLWFHSQVHAARDIDLSAFHGNYKGQLSISAGGFVIPGTTKVKFHVARSGSSAKVIISGKVSAGSTLPIGATIDLMRNGKCKVGNLVLGQKVPTKPRAGSYKQISSTKVAGKAAAIADGQKLEFDCSMAVKPQGSKKKMQGEIAMTVDGAPFATIEVTATGR